MIVKVKCKVLREPQGIAVDLLVQSLHRNAVERSESFTQDDEIESAVRDYIPFYNGARIHSSSNYLPPATYERLA